MTRILPTMVLVGLLGATGCSKPEDHKPQPVRQPPPPPGPPGSELDPIAPLAGVWVHPWRIGGDPDNAPWGERTMWEVEGSTMVESNGVDIVHYDLERMAPCLVGQREQGSRRSKVAQVLFDGDRLYARGAGGFDSEDGRHVHVCDSQWGRYLRVERGNRRCEHVLQQRFLATSVCEVTEHGDHTLVIDLGTDSPTVLVRVGKVWLERSEGGEYESALRFDSEKAALDALERGALTFPAARASGDQSGAPSQPGAHEAESAPAPADGHRSPPAERGAAGAR